MKLKLLAFDSFSTRSMATIVKIGYTKIAIDPSIAIGPYRYGLEPHPIEWKTLERDREKITKEASKCDIVIITHYHWDHCPHPEDLERIERTFENKITIIKDFKKNVNKSQNIRGTAVFNAIKNLAEEIHIGDSKNFDFDNFSIKISPPVWHGRENSRLGYVIMPYIEGNKSLLFASDIQGPIAKKTTEIILDFDPEILILSGPPTYMLGYKLGKKDLENAIKNIKQILEETENLKTVIIDHHLLRDDKWEKYFEDIIDLSRELGIFFGSAAKYLGIPEKKLEARRKELWEQNNHE